MATIASLIKADRLVRFDADLGPAEQAERQLRLSPELSDWIDGTLCYVEKRRGRDLIPYEQLEQLFVSFVRGDRLHHSSDFAKLMPQGDGVWEMKMPDVRVFGYFYKRNVFVAVCGDLVERVKQRRLYGHYRKKVIAFRKKIRLDPPEYQTGDLHALTEISD